MEGRTGSEKSRICYFFDIFADREDERSVGKGDNNVFVNVSVLSRFDRPYSRRPNGEVERGVKRCVRGGLMTSGYTNWRMRGHERAYERVSLRVYAVGLVVR